MKINSKLIKAIFFLLIIFWYGIFLSHKIDLSTADLGRHLKNGEVVLNGSWNQKWAVLHTNYYSYTLPEYQFVNHHWLTGVIFYILYSIFGFVGLSFFYILMNLSAVALFFDISRKSSNFWIASLLSIVLIPLIATRAEVRPEAFTYFLTAVFFWILFGFIRENRRKRELCILPILMLMWVNLHIGFIFGFLVLGSFGLWEFILFLRKLPNKLIDLLAIFIASLTLSLINPFFLKGLLYPFQILNNYGYLIVENQSIAFLEKLNFTHDQHFLLFEIVAIVAVLSFIFISIKNWKRVDIVLLLLITSTGILAYMGIRNFPLFALFAMPTISTNMKVIFPKNLKSQAMYNAWSAGGIIIIFCLINSFKSYSSQKSALGLGLLPQTQASANFYKEKKITGPIFNNYDIGGYLIFNLYPRKVFVDNRPEAYGKDFFQKIYILSQENDKKWQEIDRKYNFNSIFFSYRDYTPWGQQFLVTRIKDKKWAPVYVDNYNIIFLKRNQDNSKIIKKYELPKDLFSVTQNQ